MKEWTVGYAGEEPIDAIQRPMLWRHKEEVLYDITTNKDDMLYAMDHKAVIRLLPVTQRKQQGVH